MRVLLAKSLNSVNLGSCVKIFEEPAPITKKLTFMDDNEVNGNCQNKAEKESLVKKKADNGLTIEDDNKDR